MGTGWSCWRLFWRDFTVADYCSCPDHPWSLGDPVAPLWNEGRLSRSWHKKLSPLISTDSYVWGQLEEKLQGGQKFEDQPGRNPWVPLMWLAGMSMVEGLPERADMGFACIFSLFRAAGHGFLGCCLRCLGSGDEKGSVQKNSLDERCRKRQCELRQGIHLVFIAEPCATALST